MRSLPIAPDSVTPMHDRAIDAAAAYVNGTREQWWNLSRSDRAEARRCLADLIANLHTLGIRAAVTRGQLDALATYLDGRGAKARRLDLPQPDSVNSMNSMKLGKVGVDGPHDLPVPCGPPQGDDKPDHAERLGGAL